MEVVLAVVCAALGSAGLFGFFQFLINRYDNKKGAVEEIKSHLRLIEGKCDRNELATTRLQLIYLINTQPSNVDTILQTAQRYFVELDGDGEAWAVFHTWAENHQINLGWYTALLKREEGDK